MSTITKTVVSTEIGPAELTSGVAYLHDVELDGITLEIGQRVEISDGGSRLRAATVDSRVDGRWRLLIQP